MTNTDVTARPEHRDVIRMPGRTGLALAIGLLSAVSLYCTGMAFEKSYQPAIFCSPFFVGAIVGLFSIEHPVRTAFITLMAALGIAIVTLHEGVVCCLFALPLLIPVTILGALCTSTIRRYVRGRNARAVLWSLLMLTAVTWQSIEGQRDRPPWDHPVHRAVSTIVIPASPDRVFGALTTRDLVVRSDWPWFLRLGLPMPIRLHFDPEDMSVTGTFSSGVAHGHVTLWDFDRTFEYEIDRYEMQDLPFNITRLGRRSSAYGFRPDDVKDWLTIERTRYDLVPLPTGATELRREIVWRRHLAPAFYFSWLQQTIIQRGQDRLLALIRERVVDDGRDDGALVAGGKP